MFLALAVVLMFKVACKFEIASTCHIYMYSCRSTGLDKQHASCNIIILLNDFPFLTYRSIEELQQQNQKLLGVIRELSEEKEKREGDNA